MTEIITVIDPTIGQVKSMTKKQLIAFIVAQSQSTDELMQRYASKCNEIEALELKLSLAQSYIEQGRSMVESVMERWHEYDV